MWAVCLVCNGGEAGDLKVIYYEIKSLSWETNVTLNDSFCQTSGLSKDSHQVDSRLQSFDRENDPWCFCFTPRLIWQYWSNCFQQLAVCSTCHYFFWVWLFRKCNRKPKITSSCQNKPNLPPTQLLLTLCLPFSLVSSSFSPLVQFPLSSAQQLESFESRDFSFSLLLWLASPHYPIVRSRPWSRICGGRGYVRRLGSLDEKWLLCVCSLSRSYVFLLWDSVAANFWLSVLKQFAQFDALQVWCVFFFFFMSAVRDSRIDEKKHKGNFQVWKLSQ